MKLLRPVVCLLVFWSGLQAQLLTVGTPLGLSANLGYEKAPAMGAFVRFWQPIGPRLELRALGEVSRDKKWFLPDGYAWRTKNMLDLLVSHHLSVMGVVAAVQQRNSQYTKAGVTAGVGFRVRTGTLARKVKVSFYGYMTAPDSSPNRSRTLVGGLEYDRTLNRRTALFVQYEVGKVWFVQPGNPSLLSGSIFTLRTGLSWLKKPIG